MRVWGKWIIDFEKAFSTNRSNKWTLSELGRLERCIMGWRKRKDWAHLDNLVKARPDVECRRENTLTIPLSFSSWHHLCNSELWCYFRKVLPSVCLNMSVWAIRELSVLIKTSLEKTVYTSHSLCFTLLPLMQILILHSSSVLTLLIKWNSFIWKKSSWTNSLYRPRASVLLSAPWLQRLFFFSFYNIV